MEARLYKGDDMEARLYKGWSEDEKEVFRKWLISHLKYGPVTVYFTKKMVQSVRWIALSKKKILFSMKRRLNELKL